MKHSSQRPQHPLRNATRTPRSEVNGRPVSVLGDATNQVTNQVTQAKRKAEESKQSAVSDALKSRDPSKLLGRAIEKKKRKQPERPHPLVGRRVAVPQRYTEVEDDGDGFCFNATITTADKQRAWLKFDYTGEREAWCLALVQEWLIDTRGVDALSDALRSL